MTPVPPLTFDVVGTPSPQSGMKPQGKHANGSTRLVSTGGVGLSSWRNTVATAAIAARRAARHPGFDVPVVASVVFRLPMPKSRPARVRALGVWPCSVQPDLDKLERALGDSLQTGGVLSDDALIVAWHVAKVEVWQRWTGATVSLRCAFDLSGGFDLGGSLPGEAPVALAGVTGAPSHGLRAVLEDGPR